MERSADAIGDIELMSLVAAGDSGALRMLYDRHSPWLYARLMYRCNDPDIVLEVVQDAFVAVWRNAGDWRGDGPLGGWLWGIAIRRLVSQLRRRRDAVLVPDFAAYTDAALRIEDQVLLGVEFGDLSGALTTLSPEMRAVVQAVVLDGLTTKETGRLLGLNENTVKTRLRRAKQHLRSALVEGTT